MIASALIQQWGLLLFLLSTAYCLGYLIWRQPLTPDPLECFSLRITSGIALFILILFLLGITQLLRKNVLLLLCGAIIAAALWQSRLQWRRRSPWSSFPLSTTACLLLTLLILTPVLLAAFMPPMDSDEIRFHLPYARHFAESQSITPMLTLRYPFYSLNIDLLYSVGLILGTDVTPHALHVALGLIACLHLYCLGRRLNARIEAWLAVLLFWSLSPVQRLATGAYIDLGLACFAFGAFVCLCYLSTPETSNSNAFADAQHNNRLACCAGLLGGVALGAKYLAITYLPILLGWACYRGGRSAGIRFTSIAIASGLPWYAYNAFHTNNPVSPFAGQWFGYWPWNAGDADLQIQQLKELGQGHTLNDLLALPLNLYLQHWSFESPPLPLFFVAGFALIPILCCVRSRMRPYALVMFLIILQWFAGAQVLRYLLSFLPLFSLLTVWALMQSLRITAKYLLTLMGSRPPSLQPNEHRLFVLPSFLLAFLPMFLLILPGYRNNEYLLYPDELAMFIVNRENLLTATLPEYRAIQFINMQYEGQRVMQFEAGAAYSYVAGNEVVGDAFGIYRYRDFITAFGHSAESGKTMLRERGIDLLLLNKEFMNRSSEWNTLFRQTFMPVYEDNDAIVLEFPDDSRELPPTQ